MVTSLPGKIKPYFCMRGKLIHKLYFQIMSASPMARAATVGQDIPTRRVVITNEDDMPNDYSTTPGGTIFGTTPGGTKIVYERAFLINMRNSPLARTPPRNLPAIPGGLWGSGANSGA